jgi:hypothetical protein
MAAAAGTAELPAGGTGIAELPVCGTGGVGLPVDGSGVAERAGDGTDVSGLAAGGAGVGVPNNSDTGTSMTVAIWTVGGGGSGPNAAGRPGSGNWRIWKICDAATVRQRITKSAVATTVNARSRIDGTPSFSTQAEGETSEL